MVNYSVLQKEVSKFLSGADLNSITSKKVRAELEKRLGCDLSNRKHDIDNAIRSVLEASNNLEDPAGNDDKEDSGSDTDSSLSDLDDPRPAGKARQNQQQKGKQQLLSSAKSKRPPAKKAKTEGAPATAKEAPSQEMTDEELARQLHLEENGLPRRRAAAAGAAGASGASAVSGAGGKRQRKSTGGGGGGFSKPCALSPALASVLGCDSMPRQQVVKRLWDMAKERDLFDPKNKQFVICDAQFEKLFGKKRLRMFALMKYLKNHVKNVDDL